MTHLGSQKKVIKGQESNEITSNYPHYLKISGKIEPSLTYSFGHLTPAKNKIKVNNHKSCAFKVFCHV